MRAFSSESSSVRSTHAARSLPSRLFVWFVSKGGGGEGGAAWRGGARTMGRASGCEKAVVPGLTMHSLIYGFGANCLEEADGDVHVSRV